MYYILLLCIAFIIDTYAEFLVNLVDFDLHFLDALFNGRDQFVAETDRFYNRDESRFA